MPYVSDGTSWNIQAKTPWANAAAAWTALTTGPAPSVALQADAGTSASVSVDADSNRLNVRVAITTGVLPAADSRNGLLANFTLLGFTKKVFMKANPCDDVTAAIFPYCKASSTQGQLFYGGEIEPGTTYTFDLVFMGV